jgi:hypothetical protein
MMLGFVYRMHSLAMGVAGLQPIEGVSGIQNLDLSEKVSGHLRYPSLTGEILQECGFMGIRATGEIEKDDLIRMKDEHAEGKLVDFDAVAKGEPQRKKESRVADELRGLTISPPGLSPPGDEVRPPPPVIPTAVETGQFGYDHDSDDSPVRTETNVLHEGFEEPSLVNGNKENGQARREQTPESNDGDEEEFMAIKMVDYDDDDEDDEDYDKE